MTISLAGLPFILIDDNRLDLMVTGKLLEIAGLAGETRRFVDPEEALLALPDLFPDAPVVIVLLDIQMPRINGFDLLDRLMTWSDHARARFRVLMLSSTLAEEDLLRVEAHPLALGLLCKPLDLEELRQRIVLLVGDRSEGPY